MRVIRVPEWWVLLLFNVALNLGGASCSGTKPKEEVGKYRIGCFCMGSPDSCTEGNKKIWWRNFEIKGVPLHADYSQYTSFHGFWCM